jgi:hypothetical protein
MVMRGLTLRKGQGLAAKHSGASQLCGPCAVQHQIGLRLRGQATAMSTATALSMATGKAELLRERQRPRSPQALPPLEALTAAGFPEAAAREALQRAAAEHAAAAAPAAAAGTPCLHRVAELLAAEGSSPDASALARMLAAIGRNPASDPEAGAAPGGPGRRSGAGAKRGSPGCAVAADPGEREREAERRRAPESIRAPGCARPCFYGSPGSTVWVSRRICLAPSAHHTPGEGVQRTEPALGRVPCLADAYVHLHGSASRCVCRGPGAPYAGGRRLAR